MFKNIAIILLAVCCAYLLVSRQTDKNTLENQEISPAEYGGLAALRDILPQDQYREKVMPYLQDILADGKITRVELAELGRRLDSLGKLTLEASQKVRPQDALAQVLDKSVQGATDLGNQLSKSLDDALNELSRKMDEALRSFPAQPTPPPAQI